MAKGTASHWPYPVGFCPTCRRGFCTREELVIHLFERRHWSRLLAPDPAGARRLKEAVEAAEQRRQPQEEGDG
jgi:hypothetical protein